MNFSFLISLKMRLGPNQTRVDAIWKYNKLNDEFGVILIVEISTIFSKIIVLLLEYVNHEHNEIYSQNNVIIVELKLF